MLFNIDMMKTSFVRRPVNNTN